MTDLATRIEQAAGPSRELDAEISQAVRGFGFDTELRQTYGPAYTTSLDAAMTLVPEGWAVDDWQIWPGEPSTLILLETQAEGDQWVRRFNHGKTGACAATPALALCAAALRARDSDRSGEAGETRSGSTVGESADPKGIAQTSPGEHP